MIPLKDDNPTSKRPIVTIVLIVINCLIFLYEISLGGRGFAEFTAKYGLIPAELIQGKIVYWEHTPPVMDIFTSMFMHGGFLHLGGNMLYLWIFGDNIEDMLGHIKFLIFYLLCGIVAALSFAFIEPDSAIPMVGASGAISGILGAYMVRFPTARVYTLIWFFFFLRIIALPAIFILGFWFILQVINGSSAIAYSNMGGVAWFAHIGGFAFGALVFLIFGFRSRRRKYYV